MSTMSMSSMKTPSSVPSTLRYYLREMKGVSVNTFKIYPTSNTTANMGAQISVLLPQNAIIDLDTFGLYATLNTSAGCAPPRNVESLIYSIQVTANGQTIQNQVQNINLLFNVLSDLENGTKTTNIRNVLALGSGPAEPTSASVPASAAVPIVISNFLGFMSSASPRKVNTSLIGDCRLVIQIAGPEVLQAYNGATPTWSLSNLYFTIQAVSIDDGTYYQSLNAKLSEGPILVPFNYWTNFVGPQGGASTLRSTLASESINMAVATVQSYQTSYTASNSTDNTLNNTGWFTRDGSAITDSVMQLNNVFYPSYPAVSASGEVFQQTCDNYGLTHEVFGAGYNTLIAPNNGGAVTSSGLTTLTNFMQHFFVHIVRFNVDSDDERPWKSGVSTIGNNASLNWRFNVSTNSYTNVAGGAANLLGAATSPSEIIPHLFIQATAVLEIHAARQLNLVW